MPRKDYLLLLHCKHETPLHLWDKRIRGGHIIHILDQELQCFVLELFSWKSSRTYITCPAESHKVLAVRAPYLHLTLKNLQRSLAFEVLVRDSQNVQRRFRALTKAKKTQVQPYLCKMPLSLELGWNQISLPLNEFTQRAYGTRYVETLRVQIHATCRLQKIYFSQNYQGEGSGDY